MTAAERISEMGRDGVRLAIAPDGGLSTRIPLSLPVGEIRAFLRDSRDEVITLVADLDRRLASALRTLDTPARRASHRPSTLSVVAAYREVVAGLRERLDPLAAEVDDAARLFAARVVIPDSGRRTA